MCVVQPGRHPLKLRNTIAAAALDYLAAMCMAGLKSANSAAACHSGHRTAHAIQGQASGLEVVAAGGHHKPEVRCACAARLKVLPGASID